MLNGFWTVTFHTNVDAGAGVIVVNNGKVVGGDTSFTYIGPITHDSNGSVTGELQVSRHSKFLPPVAPGLENYALTLSGTASAESFDLIGKVKGQESAQMMIKGKRIASI